MKNRLVTATHCLVAACCAALLVNCSTIRTTRSPGFEFSKVDSYAWRRPPRFLREIPRDSDLLLTKMEQSIDRELQKLGIRPADPGQAAVLVDASLQMVLELQRNDPFYDLYVAEKYETASLRITLYDPAMRQLWTGRCRHTLRLVSRSTGGTKPEFHPTGEQRDWRIKQMVERILARASQI